MKNIKLIFLLAAFHNCLFSQLGPGYMGKRFQVGYSFHFSPALLGSNGSEASILGRGNAEGGDMAFNSLHEGSMEFAFKNRTSVGLSVKYYKTTFDNHVYADVVYTPSSGYTGYYTVSAQPKGFYTISGLNYTFYFKFYHKRYVAPWGRYFILGPSLNTYKCLYDPSTMYIDVDDYSAGTKQKISNFGTNGQFYMRPDLLFGWGRTRIIQNRITIDYGMNFELIALFYTLWDSVSEDPIQLFAGGDITNGNYFERTSKKRVREVNRINAFVKVGFLLF